MYGFKVKILHEATGEELTGAGEKGVVVIEGPTPPGFMQTIWKDDARFVNTYWKSIPGKMVYSTFDWGIRDEDGYFYILGRTDDVINVATAIGWARAGNRGKHLGPPACRRGRWSWASRISLKGAGRHGVRRAQECSGSSRCRFGMRLEGEIMTRFR